MKSILLTLITLAASLSFAHGGNDIQHRSWESIRADQDLEIQMPDVGGLNVFNLCATADRFRSVVPMEVCLEKAVTRREACIISGELYGQCRPLQEGEQPLYNEEVHEYTSCIRSEIRDNVEFSRYHDETVCVRHEPENETNYPARCLEYQTVTMKYPTRYNIPIYTAFQGELGSEFLGLKPYQIPACGNKY